MAQCKHEVNTECDELCECVCEACQNIFEIMWMERATKDGLCLDCGVPTTVTVESLLQTQYTHFFQPCKACEPTVKACLAKANLCEACRGPLLNGTCVKCTCTNTDTCTCIQCTTYRNQTRPTTRHS